MKVKWLQGDQDLLMKFSKISKQTLSQMELRPDMHVVSNKSHSVPSPFSCKVVLDDFQDSKRVLNRNFNF